MTTLGFCLANQRTDMDNNDESLLSKLTDLLIDTVCVVDATGRFVMLSASCEALLGYRPEELVGTPMIDLVLPEDRERTLKAASTVMDGRPHVDFENRYVRKDGRVVDIMWSARWSADHGLRLAVARDITALKYARRKQHALYEISEAAFTAENLPMLYGHIHRILVDLLPSDLFLVTDYDPATETLTFPYFSEALGAAPESLVLTAESPLADVIRQRKTLLLSARDTDSGSAVRLPGIGEYAECLIAPLISPRTVMGALVMARSEGSRPYSEADRELLHFACSQIATAIERKQAEEHLQYLATHDPLTALPNRALFNDRFKIALHRAERDNEYLALLYLDLDDFKAINDRYGHEMGDAVLCELGRRLTGCVRKSDTVARLGGDEFTVLLINIRGPEYIDTLVDKIQQSLHAPFLVNSVELRMSASIGTAIYPQHGASKHQLFHHAEGNMYKAKLPTARAASSLHNS
jgi:diguanylate cyclase (GGDEF)-like protein/PAS domain S-box-containing protein